MKRSLLVLAACGLIGCGLLARSARVQIDQARLARADALAAKTHAPLAYERYEAARKQAEASPADSAAHGAYEQEARLWLETAIAEAERSALAAQRLERERALVALDAEIVQLERARRALGDENNLRAAQALARSEAQKALARAAKKPQQRVKLSRDDARRATDALFARAELIALTLETLPVDQAALIRLREKLAEVAALREKEPEASLARADEALFLALALLAELRAGAAEPDAAERAALGEQLEAIGARLTRSDRGLVAAFEASFRGSALAAGSARTLERLCALAKAHPHGPVRLAVPAKRGADVEARVRAVRTAYARGGCEGERYAVEAARDEGDALEAVWLAY